MTDTNENLWQAVEEKVMLLISENERLHKEVSFMKAEREQHAKRINNLISLIDSVNSVDNNLSTSSVVTQQSAVLVQN